jgi:hypothetical protein
VCPDVLRFGNFQAKEKLVNRFFQTGLAILLFSPVLGCESRKPTVDEPTTYEKTVDPVPERREEGASVDIDVGNGKGVDVDIDAGKNDP